MSIRRIGIFLVGALLVAGLFAPDTAFAYENNSLAPWGKYYVRTSENVEQYHFALNYDSKYDIVPHLEGKNLSYAVEDTSSWPDPDALNNTLVGIVKDSWGQNRLNLIQETEDKALVFIRYDNEPKGSVFADTRTVYSTNDGALVSNNEPSKKTVITLYDRFFEAGDPGLFGVGGNQDEVRGLILAHEIGHVLGLADMYKAAGDPEDWPAIDDALMGNAWLADEGNPSLGSAGTPDMNGLNILQRTPWYQSGSASFYWESPGTFKSGWLSLNGSRYYFRPNATSPSLGLPFSMVTGLQPIGGSWCMFTPTGEMVTGWYTGAGGLRYYFESNGSRSHGWRTIGGATYYFGSVDDGAMRTGWQTIEGRSYYFDSDGKLQSYSPAYTSNDATNVWTQVYTMGRLASVADSLKTGTSKITRYDSNSATESAKSYEKAIRGNMLYIASQIDAGAVERKTVAYLYAIDANGTGYFFTPTAEGLVAGDDTGASEGNSITKPDGCYAANNGAVSYGYMDTLPFVTDTFDSGTAFSGGIVMKVEDIYKSSPACTVSHSATGALSGVDVIVYNSTVNTNLAGTQDGRNDSGVNNDYQGMPLTPSKVATWAAAHGFDAAAGSVIAGDDWGTSLQQTFADSVATTSGTAPLLCCPDDFSADKNARAAWAWARVYPGLYGNNPDATYCYWVDKVYHVNVSSVGTVVKYMTNQSDTVTYNQGTANQLESRIQAGVNWWNATGKTKAPWSGYAWYNGSSRASYYSDDTASEEPTNAVGIFAPVLL